MTEGVFIRGVNEICVAISPYYTDRFFMEIAIEADLLL